jgi:hypothetical protein
MRRLINGALWLVGLVVVLGVYFFVPVGRFTLYEHTLRIAATEPAQELGEDLTRTGEALGERALEEWEAREALRAEASGDASPPEGPR